MATLSWCEMLHLEYSPDILCCVAELAACNAGTEVEIADANAVVLDRVREVVIALRHGTDKDCDTLVLVETSDVVAQAHNLSIETESDLAAIGRKVIRDWVLDHLDQLLLGRSRPDLVPVQQLHHQTSKSLECTWDAHSRADPDEDVAGGLDIDLKLARLVDRRIKESE